MAIDDDTTAAHVHENSYSIIAIVAGLFAALILCAVLSFIYYEGPEANVPPTTLSNLKTTAEPGR
jgi:hypothetical protein